MPREGKSLVTIPIRNRRLGIGLSWDSYASVGVDLDIQAVVVNTEGAVVDAVYYNNLTCCNGALGHTGDVDEKTAASYNEMIWVSLQKLPENVCLIIFVVAASGKAHLRHVENGYFHVVQDVMGHNVAKIPLERSSADVDVIAIMHRDEQKNWTFQQREEPAEFGSHFLDILEPTIGDVIRQMIPHAPKKQAISFVMEKGAVIDLPQGKDLSRINVSIGGAMAACATKVVDIDISAVLYKKGGRKLGAITHGSPHLHGISHGGDDVKEGGGEDGEVITADLAQIPDHVDQIFFIVTVFEPGQTLQDVSNAWCKVADQNASELGRYVLSVGSSATGIVIARLFRSPESMRWGFQAIGETCEARSWSDATLTLDRLFKEPTHERREMMGASKKELTKKTKKKGETAQRSTSSLEEDTDAGGEAAKPRRKKNVPRVPSSVVMASPATLDVPSLDGGPFVSKQSEKSTRSTAGRSLMRAISSTLESMAAPLLQRQTSPSEEQAQKDLLSVSHIPSGPTSRSLHVRRHTMIKSRSTGDGADAGQQGANAEDNKFKSGPATTEAATVAAILAVPKDLSDAVPVDDGGGETGERGGACQCRGLFCG